MTTATVNKIVNFSDIEPNVRRGGDLRVTLSSRTCGATSGFGGTARLQPGEFVSEHYHPYSEEFLHVVSGDLELKVDGVVHRLGADDSFLVPIGRRHRLTNVGETRAHVIFHISPLAPRPSLGHVDTEELPAADMPLPAVDKP